MNSPYIIIATVFVATGLVYFVAYTQSSRPQEKTLFECACKNTCDCKCNCSWSGDPIQIPEIKIPEIQIQIPPIEIPPIQVIQSTSKEGTCSSYLVTLNVFSF